MELHIIGGDLLSQDVEVIVNAEPEHHLVAAPAPAEAGRFET